MTTEPSSFDKTSTAVLDELDRRTPENSIHRDYAAACIAKKTQHDWIGLESIARDHNVEYAPENADILAVQIIIVHTREFRDKRNFDKVSLEEELEHLGIDYAEDALELTTDGEYDTSLPERVH